MVYKGEDCIQKRINHIKTNLGRDPKRNLKKKVIVSYDIKLIEHNAFRIDNLVVLLKLNSSFYLKQMEV